MKHIIICMVVLFTMAASAFATQPSATFGSDWGNCTPKLDGTNYDKLDVGTFCEVAWDGITQDCTEANRNATITVGEAGKYTHKIQIDYLEGYQQSGFVVLDGANVICTNPTSTDNNQKQKWKVFNCNVDLYGVKNLTISPTDSAYGDCDDFGQVAVKDFVYFTYKGTNDDNGNNDVPEFGTAAAGIAVLGAVGALVLVRRRE